MHGPNHILEKTGPLRKDLRDTLTAAQRIVIFLDYDGTLVPIRKRPADATLSHRMRQLLGELTRTPGLRTGIVTGRSLNDIRSLVPDAGQLFIAANHGLEIFFHGRVWVHPAARRAAPRLDAAAKELASVLASISNAGIEHKQYTITVHYRTVRDRDVPALKSIVGRVAGALRSSLRMTDGKKVIELKPRAAWTKGDAVIRLLRLIRAGAGDAIVYIGDDVTDEDAFARLPNGAITVKVGANGPTCARYYARTVSEVQMMLKWIRNARAGVR